MLHMLLYPWMKEKQEKSQNKWRGFGRVRAKKLRCTNTCACQVHSQSVAFIVCNLPIRAFIYNFKGSSSTYKHYSLYRDAINYYERFTTKSEEGNGPVLRSARKTRNICFPGGNSNQGPSDYVAEFEPVHTAPLLVSVNIQKTASHKLRRYMCIIWSDTQFLTACYNNLPAIHIKWHSKWGHINSVFKTTFY